MIISVHSYISIYIKTTKEEKAEPEQPKMTRLASKYPKLFKVNKELED